MQFLYIFRYFDFKTKFLNVCILVASIFNALIEIGIVAIISILISRSLGFVSENDSGATSYQLLETVFQLELNFGFYFLSFLFFLVWRLSFIFLSIFGGRVIGVYLGKLVFNKICKLSTSSEFTLPHVTTVITNKINASVNGIILTSFNLVASVFSIFAIILIVIAAVGWYFVPALIFMSMLYVLLMLLLKKRIAKASEQVASRTVMSSSLIMYSFQNRGIFGVLSRSSRSNIENSFTLNDKASKHALALIRFYQEIAKPIFDFSLFIIIAYITTREGFKSSDNYGELVVVLVSLIRVVPYIQNAYRSFITYNGAIASSDLLLDILKAPQVETEIAIQKIYKTSSKTYFRLSTKNLVAKLGNVELRFPDTKFDRKNGIFTITGPSGSGKSTFLNILLGVQDYNGSLVIEVDAGRNYQQKLSFSPQSVWLFKGTVLQNLEAFSHIPLSEFGEHELIEKIKQSGFEIDTEIELKNFLFRKIGDNGQGLSGGEIKRIGILRALLCNPRILLLDEPTAGLDHDASIALRDVLLTISKDIIIIVVTHDKTISNAGEKMLVLEAKRSKKVL